MGAEFVSAPWQVRPRTTKNCFLERVARTPPLPKLLRDNNRAAAEQKHLNLRTQARQRVHLICYDPPYKSVMSWRFFAPET